MKKLGFMLLAVICLLGVVFWATLAPGSESAGQFTMLTDQKLKEKVDNKESFAMYVYSDTCIYCKQFNPILTKVLKEQNVKMNKYSTDNDITEARRILGDKYQGTPAMYVFKNGVISDYIIEKQEADKVLDFINRNKAEFKI